MVGVPKGLVGLLPYLGMGGGEHKEHAQEHNMTCNAACLRVMYLYCCFLPDLASFDIKKATLISNAQGGNGSLLT